MERATTRGALVLADGTVFTGTSIGSPGIAIGEVVFNTSMTGYQEIATDPSYAGQIVTMTSPHIGNYGIAAEDEQSDRLFCSGFIARSVSSRPSNWRSQGSFPQWLFDQGVVALADVDTRRLTRHIRTRGAMPGVIASDGSQRELADLAAAAPSIQGADLASIVTTKAPYVAQPEDASVGRVVAVDLGIKRRIISELTKRGLETHVVPAHTSATDILALNPDGLFLSNGPGDPEPLTGVVDTLHTLLGKLPVFGICLGHQVLGLSLGATTFKLPFGHHGGNHPVRRIRDGKVQITAQNHGFAVKLTGEANELFASEYGTVATTHINLNDGTVEGLACREINAFSVQFHPEAAPGPSDARGLFDEFAEAIVREVG